MNWIDLGQAGQYSFYLLILFIDKHQKPYKEGSSFKVAAIFTEAKMDCCLEVVANNLTTAIEASLSIIASLRVSFEAVQE